MLGLVYGLLAAATTAVCAQSYTTVANLSQVPFENGPVNGLYYLEDTKTLIQLGELQPEAAAAPKALVAGCTGSGPVRVSQQYQLVDHGTWWTAWELYDNNDGLEQPGGVQFDVPWTIGYSFATNAGISFSEIQTLMQTVGVDITDTISKTGVLTCAYTNNPPACVWEQSRMTWSDAQVQTCQTQFSSCTGWTTACGAWSIYQRTNAPVANDFSAFSFGCSYGSSCPYS